MHRRHVPLRKPVIKMKKTLLTSLLLCAIFAIQSFAQDEEGYWPRAYYAGIGMGVVATRGDIGNDDNVVYKLDDGTTETVHFPALDLLAMPDFILGVNIREFSLSANFNYWRYTEVMGGFPDESNEQGVRIYRLGFEFAYNLYWPEYFQPRIGIGYAYTNIRTNECVFPSDTDRKLTSAELMGSSIAFIFGIRYFWTDHIVLQPDLKFYEAWFGHLNTKEMGTFDLKHKKWQTFAVMEVDLIWQF